MVIMNDRFFSFFQFQIRIKHWDLRDFIRFLINYFNEEGRGELFIDVIGPSTRRPNVCRDIFILLQFLIPGLLHGYLITDLTLEFFQLDSIEEYKLNCFYCLMPRIIYLFLVEIMCVFTLFAVPIYHQL